MPKALPHTNRQKRTTEEMGDKGFTQLTKWLPCLARIASQWGLVDASRWCELEAKRIDASPDHKARHAIADGAAAVFGWTSQKPHRSQGRPAA